MSEADDNRRAPESEGPFQGLRNWFRQLRGGDEQDFAQSLETLLGEAGEGAPVGPHERRLLLNILKSHDVTAADVMVPRVDISALPVDTPFAEAARQIAALGHSRVPVYRETLDDAIGIVHIKDLLPYAVDGRTVPLSDIVRKVLFVAPTMHVLDLLLQMRLSRIHLALVVDEFGGVDGLVTIEDVIEVIVGEIEDEHDEEGAPHLLERDDDSIVADARTPIEEIEARTGRRLLTPETEDVHSLGGLVFSLAGRVPARGEIIPHPAGLEFEVLDADPRRVKRVRLRGLGPAGAAP